MADIEVKVPQSESQKRNVETITNISTVDISEKGLSQRTNKEVDEGFIRVPTSDKFITTQEKSRGIVTYPILLIENITEDSTLDILKSRLSKLEGGTQDVKVMYKRSNKAISLCTTRDVPDIDGIFVDFCVESKYFISKGNIVPMDFKQNFDFSGLEIIQDIDNFIHYKDTLIQREPTGELAKKIKDANDFIDKVISLTDKEDTTAKESLYEDIGLGKPVTPEQIKSPPIVPPMIGNIVPPNLENHLEKNKTDTPTLPEENTRKEIIGFGESK